MSDQQLQKTEEQIDYLVIDGSGSMRSKWWDMMDALDAFVQTAKAEGVRSRVIATVFDTYDMDFEQRNQMMHEWDSPRIRPIEMKGGGTPLYDAVNNVARKLKELDPPRASIVFVTDGSENGSRYTDIHQAKAFINWMKAKGWQVTFIGANFANDEQAVALGVDRAAAIGVEKSHLKESMKALARKRGRYSREGEDMHFSEGERQQFGGYLAGPSK